MAKKVKNIKLDASKGEMEIDAPKAIAEEVPDYIKEIDKTFIELRDKLTAISDKFELNGPERIAFVANYAYIFKGKARQMVGIVGGSSDVARATGTLVEKLSDNPMMLVSLMGALTKGRK